MEIKVNMWEDYHDCETCGYSYASGGEVCIDGELVISKPPMASCFGGDHCDHDELLILALKEVGINVDINWERFEEGFDIGDDYDC